MHRIRSGKVAAPTKHLEKARGMKRASNRLLRREGHETSKWEVFEVMQTYSIEAAKNDLSMLAHLAAKGQEVLLTENDKPLAKLVSVDVDEAHRQKVRELQGFLRGMDTTLDDRGRDRL